MSDLATPRQPRPGTVMARKRIEIELDFADPAAVAEFLELASMALRARRRIVIAIE